MQPNIKLLHEYHPKVITCGDPSCTRQIYYTIAHNGRMTHRHIKSISNGDIGDCYISRLRHRAIVDHWKNDKDEYFAPLPFIAFEDELDLETWGISRG